MNRHIVTDGEVVLAEDVTPAQTTAWLLRGYRDLGGQAFFQALTTAFYQLVAADEVLAALFPDSWEEHAARLAAHYDRMYGQPDLSEAWAPRLLTAHTTVLISHRHRARWLDLMREAGRQVGAPEPVFSDFIASMVIASGDMMATSRGAAIARHVSFDRYGEAKYGEAKYGEAKP
jgi:truncated hemoglobin YjbI